VTDVEPHEGRVAKALLPMVDKALSAQAPPVNDYVEKLRRAEPSDVPAEIVAKLEKRFLTSVTFSGAAVGLSAAVPGAGTAVAVAGIGADTVFFFEASALFALAVAEVHGVPVHDIDRRRTLVLAVMLGNSGAKIFEQAAGRTGKHWGRTFTAKVPMSSIRNINKVLGQNFVTKYGTKQGIITIGKVAPAGFGALIGGGGNHLMARGVVKGARAAFGAAPDAWPTAAPADEHQRPTETEDTE